jgi:hypothetical protein
MSKLPVQTVSVTFQETIAWGGIPITIACEGQSVHLVVTDCCDPFPSMHRWLEAITTGVQCCSFYVDEEGSDKRISLEQTCNGSQLSIVDKYYEPEIFIRSEVNPVQLVQAFYQGLREYAHSPLYIEEHWHDKSSLHLGCNLSELKSPIIENWLSERRSP